MNVHRDLLYSGAKCHYNYREIQNIQNELNVTVF